jgi:hypothetical protein
MNTIDLRPIITKHHRLLMKGKGLDRLKIEKDLHKLGMKHGMQGAGIFDWVKKGYEGIKRFLSGPRLNFSPTIRKILEKYGDQQILSISVHRRPIFNIIEKLANWLSLGRYEQNKAKLSYDKLFHLYIIIKINGLSLKVEKNEQVNVVKSTTEDQNADGLPVGSAAGLTLRKFLEEPLNRNILTTAQYFGYRAYSTNCQHFVHNLLKASGLLTAQLNNFIMQDTEAVLEGVGYFKKIADTTTDLAARAKHAMEGGKVKRKQKPVSEATWKALPSRVKRKRKVIKRKTKN